MPFFRSLYQRVFSRKKPQEILASSLQKWVQTQPNSLDAQIAESRILTSYRLESSEIDLSDLSITTLPVELTQLKSLEYIKINKHFKPVENYSTNKRLKKLTLLYSQSLIQELVNTSQNFQEDYSLNLTTDQQQELNDFLKNLPQDNLKKAFLRFIEGDYYQNTSSTKKADISKKLLDCLWQIYQRKDDQNFMKNVNNFCTDSLTDCESRNHFFIFDLVNFVNIKPKSELNSSSPFQKFEFLKNQALFNYVKKNASDFMPKTSYKEFGRFKESVHYTLRFLQAFNDKFGQQLNLQLLDISSETLNYHDESTVNIFLDSFNPIAKAYQSKNYQPINKIICEQLADDYFEGFWGTYLTELDFIDKKNLDKIIKQQEQIRDKKTEELNYEDPNYEQGIEKIARDCKLETKKLLAKHFLGVLKNLQSPKILASQSEGGGEVYQTAGAFNQLQLPTHSSYNYGQSSQQNPTIHRSLLSQNIYRPAGYSADGSIVYHPQPILASQPADGFEEVDGAIYQTAGAFNQLQLPTHSSYNYGQSSQQNPIHRSLLSQNIYRPAGYSADGSIVYHPQPILASQPADGFEEVDGAIYQTAGAFNRLPPTPYSHIHRQPLQDQQIQIFRPSQYPDGGLIIYNPQPISTYYLRKPKARSKLPKLKPRPRNYYSTSSSADVSSSFSALRLTPPKTQPKFAWV